MSPGRLRGAKVNVGPNSGVNSGNAPENNAGSLSVASGSSTARADAASSSPVAHGRRGSSSALEAGDDVFSRTDPKRLPVRRCRGGMNSVASGSLVDRQRGVGADTRVGNRGDGASLSSSMLSVADAMELYDAVGDDELLGGISAEYDDYSDAHSVSTDEFVSSDDDESIYHDSDIGSILDAMNLYDMAAVVDPDSYDDSEPTDDDYRQSGSGAASYVAGSLASRSSSSSDVSGASSVVGAVDLYNLLDGQSVAEMGGIDVSAVRVNFPHDDDSEGYEGDSEVSDFSAEDNFVREFDDFYDDGGSSSILSQEEREIFAEIMSNNLGTDNATSDQ